MKFQVGSTSRIGNRRTNEDSYAVLSNPHTVLLLIADGMGGHNGGKLASETFIQTVERLFNKQTGPIEDPVSFLREAVLKAHDQINAAGAAHSPPLDPRTTCVLCLIQSGYAWWAHLGDSRLYLFRHGEAIFRTRDHSRVESLLQQGLITQQEVRDHPYRNHITRCLGGPSKPASITLSKAIQLQMGDILLLCSDGLWSGMRTKEIAEKLTDEPLDELASNLASAAEEIAYPKSDNITLVLLRWLSHATDQPPPEEKRPAKQEDVPEFVPPQEQDDISRAISDVQAIFSQYEKELNS
ncbi:MAG: protein phosphatase 2C domain-containing protein [Pseudomonadota bacterium]